MTFLVCHIDERMLRMVDDPRLIFCVPQPEMNFQIPKKLSQLCALLGSITATAAGKHLVEIILG